jgi:DNA-binding transcriptional ArsR family regulator
LEPPDARARLEALDAVFGALNHAARRQVLLTLHFRGGSMSAGEIAKRFSHAWPTTTRHLRVLEEAGLLTHERQGRTVVYRIDRSRLDLISQWLAWFGPNEEHDGESGTTGGGGDSRVRARTPRRA